MQKNWLCELTFWCVTKLFIEKSTFRCYEAPLHEGLSVRPSVRPLRLLIYPLIEVFRSTLCRVSGLVFSKMVVGARKARAPMENRKKMFLVNFVIDQLKLIMLMFYLSRELISAKGEKRRPWATWFKTWLTIKPKSTLNHCSRLLTHAKWYSRSSLL